MNKKCTLCKKTFSTSNFFKNPSGSMGLHAYCKKCHRKRAKEGLDYPRERLYQANWRQTYNYKLSKKQKKAKCEKSSLWAKNNKQKRNAQVYARRAISRGELIRPKVCENCSVEGRIEAAHTDYSKPLDVMWLCVRCHRRMDSGTWINLLSISQEMKPKVGGRT